MGIINRGSFSSVGTLFVPFVFFFYFFFHLFYLEEFRMKMIILIGLFLSVITVEPKSIQRKKAAGNAEQRARQLDQGSATVEDRYENGEEQVLQKMLRIRQAVQLQAADSVEKIMQAADKAEEPDEAKRESTGKAVENATTTTKTSIQNKYAVTEDAEENKKIIVIEKQSKAADQKSAKEEALTAKTGGLEQLIVKGGRAARFIIPPTPPCYWGKEWPCGRDDDGFPWSYGCLKGSCWSQCTGPSGEWCWTEKEPRSVYSLKCTTTEDCTQLEVYKKGCAGACTVGW